MNASDAWAQVLTLAKGLVAPAQEKPSPVMLDPLFHQGDRFQVALPALERLQTKKNFEKVIGAKFNLNDEVNQISQQRQLNQIGLAELRAMYSRQYNGEKPSW